MKTKKKENKEIKMNRNQRATRNNGNNKPFVSGGVMTNFTATPAQATNSAAAAVAPTPALVQAQAINVGPNYFLITLFFPRIFFFGKIFIVYCLVPVDVLRYE